MTFSGINYLAVVIAALLCVAASRPVQPVGSAIFVLGLLGFCVAVFVWALGMPVLLFS